MNRKNTILIAVLINAGLLTLLLAVAVTSGDSPEKKQPEIVQKELELPKFDDTPLYQELPSIAALETSPQKEEENNIVHKLPELTCENQEIPKTTKKTSSTPVVKIPSIPRSHQIAVKKGDNLEKLARAHQTTVDEIIKLNRLPSSFLKIGQVLKIPPSRTVAKAKTKVEKAGPEYYVIKVGENPWAIALRHKLKLDELLRLNDLNEEKARKLRPGDRLRIR